jgi:transposase-like protein
MSNSDKSKRQYSKEFKEKVIKKLESPTNETVPQIAKELGIPKTTIYQWIKTNRESKEDVKNVNKAPKKWNSKDKFHVVLETSTLTEEELSTYCRRKGLYPDEVKGWIKQCIDANTQVLKDPEKIEEELRAEKQKTKALEKELRFKEKALAETAALLVLRKKAQAIWGDTEEE